MTKDLHRGPFRSRARFTGWTGENTETRRVEVSRVGIVVRNSWARVYDRTKGNDG